MYGVITSNPAVSFEGTAPTNEVFVLTTGIVEVRVTGANGPIAVGSLITTSETPGVGQAAIENGYVLGNALTSYEPANPADEGKVLVSLNVHPTVGLANARSNLIQVIRQGVAEPLLEPLDSLR